MSSMPAQFWILRKTAPEASASNSIQDALLERSRVLMSVLNLCEVFYHSWQRQGEDRLNLSQSLQAGGIRARHKIPSVDCIAAGLAILHQAVLVTSDRDFEKLGRPIEVL
jgi:predicted nucleic acid-binding protein